MIYFTKKYPILLFNFIFSLTLNSLAFASNKVINASNEITSADTFTQKTSPPLGEPELTSSTLLKNKQHRAHQFLTIKNYNQAAEIYEEILKEIQNSSNEYLSEFILQKLAQCYFYLKKQNDFDKTFDSLLINPKDSFFQFIPLIKLELAQLLFNLNNYSHVTELYEETLKNQDESSTNHNLILKFKELAAPSYSLLKHYRQAAEIYEEIYEELSKNLSVLNMENVLEAKNNAALAYYNLKHYKHAAKLYEEILKETLKYPDTISLTHFIFQVKSNAALAYVALGEDEHAIDLYKILLQNLDTSSTKSIFKIRYEAASVYFRLRNYKQAAELYEKVLQNPIPTYMHLIAGIKKSLEDAYDYLEQHELTVATQ